MLIPLSRCQLCESQISSRPVKMSGGNYGTAIIFFTPKIGDKNVDIATLTCEFTQIIDRGDWGKEEVSYSVDASSPSNRKYREFQFETDCDSYELKFFPPTGLKLGIIEVFFDLESINQSNNMADFNNPSNVDFTPLIQAIQSGSDAQVAATNAGTAANNPVVAALDERPNYAAVPWSSVPSNHIALQPDPKRTGGTIWNEGNKAVAVDRFINIADKTAAPQHDGFIAPGGSYKLSSQDATQGVLLYTLTNNGTQSCRINLEKKA